MAVLDAPFGAEFQAVCAACQHSDRGVEGAHDLCAEECAEVASEDGDEGFALDALDAGDMDGRGELGGKDGLFVVDFIGDNGEVSFWNDEEVAEAAVVVAQAEDFSLGFVVSKASFGEGGIWIGDVDIGDDAFSDEGLVGCRFDDADELVSENSGVVWGSAGVDVGLGDEDQEGAHECLARLWGRGWAAGINDRMGVLEAKSTHESRIGCWVG